ncbi:MAG: hypothetical protein R3Y66_07840, partial [Rikenellaceae bacterium]
TKTLKELRKPVSFVADAKVRTIFVTSKYFVKYFFSKPLNNQNLNEHPTVFPDCGCKYRGFFINCQMFC